MLEFMSVKVYKTTVDDTRRAEAILTAIRQAIPGCDPSLDLDDCDSVLRIEYPRRAFDETTLEDILARYGYQMNILD